NGMLPPSFAAPFDGPSEATAATTLLKSLRDNKWTLSQLAYVVLGTDHPIKPIALQDVAIRAMKKAIYDSVNELNEKHPDIDGDNEATFSSDVLREKVSLYYEDVVDELVGLIDGT